jgi:hypothetical protein
MHAFPNTTFVDNHAHVRIIRRNLMVVFSSAPHASSLDAHGLEWANILLVSRIPRILRVSRQKSRQRRYVQNPEQFH